jgi:hypothetical protein
MEDLSSESSHFSQMNRSGESYGQISVLASCYMATTSSAMVEGFHYCTTSGAGKFLAFDRLIRMRWLTDFVLFLLGAGWYS